MRVSRRGTHASPSRPAADFPTRTSRSFFSPKEKNKKNKKKEREKASMKILKIPTSEFSRDCSRIVSIFPVAVSSPLATMQSTRYAESGLKILKREEIGNARVCFFRK